MSFIADQQPLFSCFSILEFASKGLEISSHLNIMTIMTLLSSDKIKSQRQVFFDKKHIMFSFSVL